MQSPTSKTLIFKIKSIRCFFVQFCLASLLCFCSLAGSCWAQAGEEAEVGQYFLLDETRQLHFETVRDAAFQPLNPKVLQNFTEGVGWVRLRQEASSARAEPLLLQIRPPFFSHITVYKESATQPGQWVSHDIAPDNYFKPIALGLSEPGDTAYLRLQSLNDFRVDLTWGSADALQRLQRKIDMGASVIVTLMVGFLFAILMQTGGEFTRLKLALSLFLVVIISIYLLVFGFFQLVIGLSPVMSGVLMKIFWYFNKVLLGTLLVLFAKEMLSQSRWINWLFLWPGVFFALTPLLFIDSDILHSLIDVVAIPASVVYFIFLVTHAVLYPYELPDKYTKIVFYMLLLLFLFVFIKSSMMFMGWDVSPVHMPNLNIEIEFIFKGFIPFLICSVAFLVLEKAKKKRFTYLHNTLQIAQHDLDLERKMLDRQRKFTAMLSHELKNPLMAGHLALGNLQRNMADGAPALQSADTIRHSLDSIDAIIERCSEVDAYEQGKMPVVISNFTVAELISSIKAANTHQCDRICIITRRLDDSLAIASDMHYLKIIINNLLINALKYSEPDTLVEWLLTFKQENSHTYMRFSVSNSLGSAGAPDINQLFERFYRSEGAKQQPGTGQGLWLSQSMAQALGSHIFFETDGVAVSFTFSIAI